MQDLVNMPVSAFVAAVGAKNSNDDFELEGTAFVIGSKGTMLTAAHVAEALNGKDEPVAMFFDNAGKPAIAAITEFECHPTEDVAVVRLEEGNWASIHDITPTLHYGSAEVMMWAYPETVATEHQRAVAPDHPDSSTMRPDLIYFQGYIRRRISRELPFGLLRGKAFYEMSQIGGACASGAPVSRRAPGEQWKVIGIYVGEVTSDARREIGIVVRADAFHDWEPRLLGNAIGAEVHTHV